jgi:manganese/iron transport system permease protein
LHCGPSNGDLPISAGVRAQAWDLGRATQAKEHGAIAMNPLFAPFQYDFMVQALVVGSLVGAVCAILSCFLVLKGWSLMGDAISHAVLPGIVIAYMVGIPLAIGAFFSGLLCAAATGFIKENSRVKEDTSLGIVFTGLFALGLVLFTKVETDVHLNHILFGSLLAISQTDVLNTSIVGGITLLIVIALRKDLLLFCFDPNQAQSIGLNTKLLYYILLSLLASTVVVSLQAVGIILVIAMLVTPGCIAYLLCDRFTPMLWVSVASAVASCLAGTMISYFLNCSTAGCIVLVQAAVFILALVFAPKHGLLVQRFRSRARLAKPVIS